uniref:Uncharacterized protein n=1 Tax=Cannabis sativa TaxID=3483 RepID=A0A803PQE8_CANSA
MPTMRGRKGGGMKRKGEGLREGCVQMGGRDSGRSVVVSQRRDSTKRKRSVAVSLVNCSLKKQCNFGANFVLLYLLEPAPITLIVTAVAVTFGAAFRALNYGKEMEQETISLLYHEDQVLQMDEEEVVVWVGIILLRRQTLSPLLVPLKTVVIPSRRGVGSRRGRESREQEEEGEYGSKERRESRGAVEGEQGSRGGEGSRGEGVGHGEKDWGVERERAGEKG